MPGFGRKVAPDARDANFPMRLMLDPLRSMFFPQGLPPGTRHYRSGPVLDQGETSTCFPANTLIELESGATKPIQNIALLERVRTAEGNVGTVLQTMARFTSEPLLKMELFGHSHLRMTVEHPVLTKRGYVACGQLQPGDYVALTMPRQRDVNHAIRPARWTASGARHFQGRLSGPTNAGGVATSVVAVPETITLTKTVGRLFGLYLAEGSASPHKTIWTFNETEDELIRETVELLGTLGVEARIQPRPNHSVNVCLYSALWSVWFAGMFGRGAAHKGIPGELMSGPVEFLDGLLSGWVDGDGSHRRDSTQGVSVSHELIINMARVAHLVGKRPSVTTCLPKPSHGVKTRQRRWDLKFQDTSSDSYRCHEDGHIWRRVRRVVPEEFIGPVFNLQVEGDNSYVAEGIGVHNCVGHGWAGWSQGAPLMIKPMADMQPFALYDQFIVNDEFDDNDVDPDRQMGTSVRAGAKVLKQMGHIKNYLWAESAEDVRAWHLAGFGTVVLGINWYDGMMEPDKYGRLIVSGGIAGGHCVKTTGWNDERDMLRIQNSWGRGWGEAGHAWISRQDLQRLLTEDGEACAATEQKLL